MTAGDEMKVYATPGEFTPAQVGVADPSTGLSLSAKDCNASFKGRWHKVWPGEIDFDGLLFTLSRVRGN